MSQGLLIKDTQGRTIMGPETFTVRSVDSRLSGVGGMSPGQVVKLAMSSKVKAGMFAIVAPLRQFGQPYTQEFDLDLYSVTALRSLPYVTVYDGYVNLIAPSLAGGRTDGNVAIHVFTNV